MILKFDDMRSCLLLLPCLFLSFGLFSQEYAEFSVDTTAFMYSAYERDDVGAYHFSQIVWYVNGQKIQVGSEAIQVAVDPNKLDTILFLPREGDIGITLICNITEAKHYEFFLGRNDEGAFNIREKSTQKVFKGSVQFRLKGADDKTYLGTLGEDGILVTSNLNDTLIPHCRKTSGPNMYEINFRQIEACEFNVVNACTEKCCLRTVEKVEWDFYYRILSQKLNVWYIPISDDPLIITYDSETEDFDIK